jgi:hypothetical protein
LRTDLFRVCVGRKASKSECNPRLGSPHLLLLLDCATSTEAESARTSAFVIVKTVIVYDIARCREVRSEGGAVYNGVADFGEVVLRDPCVVPYGDSLRPI